MPAPILGDINPLPTNPLYEFFRKRTAGALGKEEQVKPEDADIQLPTQEEQPNGSMGPEVNIPSQGAGNETTGQSLADEDQMREALGPTAVIPGQPNGEPPAAIMGGHMTKIPGGMSRIDAIGKGYEGLKSASREMADTEKLQAAEEEKEIRRQREDLEQKSLEDDANRQIHTQEAYTRLSELDNEAKNIAKQKIDQGRIFRNPVGILGALVVGLSAIGSKNPEGAVQTINQAIQHDIDVQQANLQNRKQALSERRGIFSDYLGLMKNEEQARLLSEAQMKRAAGVKLQEIAARYKSPLIEAMAKQQKSILDLEANDVEMKVYTQIWRDFHPTAAALARAYKGYDVPRTSTQMAGDQQFANQTAQGATVQEDQLPDERGSLSQGLTDQGGGMYTGTPTIEKRTDLGDGMSVGTITMQREAPKAAPGLTSSMTVGKPTISRPAQTIEDSLPPMLRAVVKANPIPESRTKGLAERARAVRAETLQHLYDVKMNELISKHGGHVMPNDEREAATYALAKNIELRNKADEDVKTYSEQMKDVATLNVAVTNVKSSLAALDRTQKGGANKFLQGARLWGLGKSAQNFHNLAVSYGMSDDEAEKTYNRILQSIHFMNQVHKIELTPRAIGGNADTKMEFEKFLDPDRMSADSIMHAADILGREVQARKANALKGITNPYARLRIEADTANSYGTTNTRPMTVTPK